MEEVKRAKSNNNSKQKIPVYPNGRSSSLRPTRSSNISLTPVPGSAYKNHPQHQQLSISNQQMAPLAGTMTTSQTALNNSLAQGILSQ